MNSISPQSALADANRLCSDEAKLMEGRLQLEDEAYSRKRRIRNRRQRQAKFPAQRRVQRRNRAIKLSLFWTGAVALGTFWVVSNAGEIVAVLTRALGAA
jgi:hypothetical protein